MALSSPTMGESGEERAEIDLSKIFHPNVGAISRESGLICMKAEV